MLPSEVPRLATDLPLRVFPGVWKLLFFFPSLWLSHSLGYYLTLAPSDCPQGITLSNAAHTSLFSPCLLVADVSVWATLLGVAIRYVICGFYVFIFPPGYVAL